MYVWKIYNTSTAMFIKLNLMERMKEMEVKFAEW